MKLWSPSKDSRICSKHFIDGEPTVQNPHPTLELGYEGYQNRVKRISYFGNGTGSGSSASVKVISEPTCAPSCPDDSITNFECTEDPPVESLPKRKGLFDLIWPIILFVIGLLTQLMNTKRKIEHLQKENENLHGIIKQMKKRKEGVCMKTDKDANFLTGIKTISLFSKIHDIVAPLVTRRWTGVSSMIRGLKKYKKKPLKLGPTRKLSSKSEFLLALMKLRLGLLNKDLAHRFDISETLCSRIFFSWLRASSRALRHLVFIPDQETLVGTKPDRFRNLPDLHSIIDCTEIFIETPKDLYLQSATWSDYKHHNTGKNIGRLYSKQFYLLCISCIYRQNFR